MREGALVLDHRKQIIYWHFPEDRTSGYIPDSNKFWEFLWSNREVVKYIAHSHPGGGIPHPSTEDLTTFRAIELGLGKHIIWYIMSEDSLVEIQWRGDHYEVLPLKTLDWVFELYRKTYTKGEI